MTVGIDVGTSSVKALAADGGGRVLARARIPHALVTDSPFRLEHDARLAWREGPRRALDEVVGQLRSEGQPVPRAVAVSAMVPSLTAVDADGMPIGPGVLYDDERGRSGGQARDGDPTRSLETLTLLTWAASNFPGARGYWPAQAVANRALGGPPAIDLGTAFSAGPLFGGDGWDALRLARAGVDRSQLPEMVMFGEIIGEVDRLPNAALVAGGVDALCEEMVAGPLAPGDVLVVCGSTLVVWVVAESELSSIDHLTERVPPDGLWRLPSLTRGLAMVGGPSNAGGLFLDWVDRLIRPAVDHRLDPRAVPVWQPYLRGERVPFHDPGLRGGLSGLDVTQTPAALRRAAYEASAMALRMIVERAGAKPKRIVATGGGSQVRGWLRAIADVTGVPVQPVAVPEGAALGAAWLARIGARLETSIDDAGRWAAYGAVVEPDPAWVTACAERYQQYARQYVLGGGGSPG